MSLLLLVGTSMPVGLHADSMENCTMQHMGSDTHEGMMDHDMGNSHADMKCDYGFSCMCSIEESPVRTQAPVVMTLAVDFSLPESNLTLQDAYQETEEPSTSHQGIIIQDYGPPIFVLNQTFLI